MSSREYRKDSKIYSGSTKQTDRTLSKHVKILLSPASPNAYMRVALSCRYPHIEVLLSRSTTINELIEKLTQYWQLSTHAQSVSVFSKKKRREKCVCFSYSGMIYQWNNLFYIFMDLI